MTSPLHSPGAFLLRDLSVSQQSHFQEGCRLFNERLFWEAHEAWETVWREVHDPQKRMIQGLIQCAAAYHLIVARPRLNGAVRNIEKSLDKLDSMPDVCFGIAVGQLREMLERTRAEVVRIGEEGLRCIGDAFIPTI